MAKSYNSYVGNGSTQVFSLTFPYLAKSHVKVYVGGVEDTTFTWLTSSSLTLTAVPANGVIVLIKRVTPTTPLIDFVDGSVVTESLLDTATIQALYVAEETQDTAASAIILDPNTNKWMGNAKVLNNLADPVDAQDAVTKHWAENAMSSQLVQATAQATNAAASATSASSSATSATNSSITATVKALEALNSASASGVSASNALTSETNAAASAATATTKASQASTSAANAAASEAGVAASAASALSSKNAAATSETNAASSATNAASSANAASTSATAAANSATSADSSKTNAASSATNAASSATNASASASAAASSATNAASSASAASSSASAASLSETHAAASEASALAAKSASEAARDATLTALDSFDDRYLGQKTADPTLDNDGNALLPGALYYNSVDKVMKVYEGSVWVAAYASLSGALLVNNNLSDVLNAAAARTNIGAAASAITISAGSGLTGGGDLSANRSLALTDTGVTAGAYGSSRLVNITVDAKGRITALVDGSIPVLSVGATAPISSSGGSNPTISLSDSGVTAGSYGSSSVIPVITVDAKGRVTNASTQPIPSGFPTGGIIMWSGAKTAIPSGWALCDGLNGTPNLQDRFVIGAGSTYAVGNTGGATSGSVSVSGTTASGGAHSHGLGNGSNGSAGTATSTAGMASVSVANGCYGSTTIYSAQTTVSTTDSGHSHTFSGSGSVATLPPYYALCFIMKL